MDKPKLKLVVDNEVPKVSDEVFSNLRNRIKFWAFIVLIFCLISWIGSLFPGK